VETRGLHFVVKLASRRPAGGTSLSPRGEDAISEVGIRRAMMSGSLRMDLRRDLRQRPRGHGRF
jgi:hypothetical protein